MLMDWGVKKADELQLEYFLSSTLLAIQFYKNFDFLVFNETPLGTTVSHPSEEWKELEKQYPKARSTAESTVSLHD